MTFAHYIPCHPQSDIVIFTNDNPRTEEPDRIIADMVAGLPPEIRNRHAGSVHSWLVDRIRVPVCVCVCAWTVYAIYHSPSLCLPPPLP